MRVIHTADWHLGQRFSSHYRKEEHDSFLNWLYESICENEVETLIVAGDIFDSTNPPTFAQEQYYRFLAKLSGSPCRHVVITGGNHDNPHFLQAADPILSALNIRVIGAAPEDFSQQIIALPDAENPRLIVAAIPYLRDADLRKSRLGDSSDAIEEQVRNGIIAHYRNAADGCCGHREKGIPTLATGHLFAQGCSPSDTERSIHVGNLGQINAEAFTDVFDYVALGHLHRPQRVGGKEHIRYSGSPIPLSFSEREYPHQVLLLEFSGARCPQITELRVPVRRRLIQKEDTLENLLFFAKHFRKEEGELVPWMNFVFSGAEQPLEARRKLMELALTLREELVLIDARAVPKTAEEHVESAAAAALSESLLRQPTGVFEKLLQREAINDEKTRNGLQKTFAELLERYYQSPLTDAPQP